MNPPRLSMDIRSTKTPAQRQEDEAARLVREAPKYKPPRRDLRRERDNSDQEVDPDEAADRKDRSDNYKDVGGSAKLVVARYLWAMEFATENELKAYLKEHPDADPSKHSVKETEDQPAAPEEEVSEKPKGKEEGPGADASKTKELMALGGKLHQLAKQDKALAAQFKLFQPGGFYDGMAKEDPNFDISRLPWSKALPEEFRNMSLGDIKEALLKAPVPKGKGKAAPPEAQPGTPAVPPETGKPGEAAPSEAQSPGEAAPPEATPPKAKQKGKGPKPLSKPVPPKRENYETDEEFAQSQDAYKKSLADFKNKVQEFKSIPKPQRKDYEDEGEFEEALAKHKKLQSLSDTALADDDADTPPQETAPQAPEKPKVPEPARPEASLQEKVNAHQQLRDVFGGHTAEELTRSGLHPQDASTLVDMYTAIASKPEKDIGAHAAKVAQFYETNPKRVPLPKMGQNEAGDTVPFEQLSAQEQGEAYRRHQLRTVAISIAAERSVREAIAKTLPKGTDARVAGELAAVLLQPEGEGRSAWASKAADRTYQTAIEMGGAPIPAKNVQALLASLGDNEDAKKIAVSYLQGQDFNAAKKIFLSQGTGVGGAIKKGLGWAAGTAGGAVKLLWDLLVDKDSDYEKPDIDEAQEVVDEYQNISEWSTPKQIGKAIRGADKFMQLRAKNYPQEFVGEHDPAVLFRQQVLQRVQALSPEKYAPVRALLEEHDFNNYEHKQAEFEDKQAEWEQEKDLHLHQAGGRAPEKPDRKKFKSDEDYQQAIAAHGSLSDERRAAEWAWEKQNPPPKPPMKPANYDRTRNPKALRDMRKWLLAEQFSQHGGKTAASVAARFVISSYPSPSLMASVSEKAAVYHGVAPYRDAPTYAPWTPAHQRDIGESDYEMILRAAKDWMKTPVLSVDLSATPKDVQFRAALDLAIYDSHYNGQIQPNIYNLLLSRLSGANEHETLLTQRQAANSPIGQQRSQKVATMKASTELRKMAAKYAAENAPLAYDLMDLASKLAQDEQQGEQDQGQKQAQDQTQQGQGQEQEKQASKYASLRSAVIQAATKNPEARAAFLPILQAVKGLDT